MTQPAIRHALLAALALVPSACSAKTFRRETDTTGTFRTEAMGVQLLFYLIDIPWDPRLRALELARDSWGDNLQVMRYSSYPDLGFFNFLNGLIIGFRGAIVYGEYGIPPDTPEARDAFERALRRRGPYRAPDDSTLTPPEGTQR